MKSIIKLIKYILPCCLLFMMGCEDQNSINQEYIDRGEEIYTGRIDSVLAYSGNQRVKFEWWISTDPRITKTVIYWNESDDSTVIPVNRTQTGNLTMEVALDIPEGTYTFEFVTKDNFGHRSLGLEKTVEIYGDRYIATLSNRLITSMTRLSETEVRIAWQAGTLSTIQYSTLRYMDYSNPDNPIEKTVRVENEDTETVLSGIRLGDQMRLISTHLPEGGIDLLDALPRVYTLPI
jgi:hypothetical protein